MKFRTLKASEIECRVATVKEKGFSLLLYKDARCDMNILDETVTPLNWQRQHGRENHNCTVSIWDEQKKQWISKEDTGTESNAEKEKGLASDSFKRACFNWGIGRELYTAPFIWVNANPGEVIKNRDKFTTYEKFKVSEISYNEGVISELKIVDKLGNVRFSYPSGNAKPQPKPKVKEQLRISTMAFTKCEEAIKTGKYTVEDIAKKYELTEEVRLALKAIELKVEPQNA